MLTFDLIAKYSHMLLSLVHSSTTPLKPIQRLKLNCMNYPLHTHMLFVHSTLLYTCMTRIKISLERNYALPILCKTCGNRFVFLQTRSWYIVNKMQLQAVCYEMRIGTGYQISLLLTKKSYLHITMSTRVE